MIPVLFLLLGGGVLLFLAVKPDDREVPVHEPDAPAMPGSTGYKRVDAILDSLRHAADVSGIPLGLLVGWIARESGGKLATHPQPGPGDTKYDERGYFQLMPAESKALGLDHQRLSVDPEYSILGGIKLIQEYMRDVDAMGVAPRGSAYYWRLVKLCHTMGSGAAKKIVAAAKAEGKAQNWDALEAYALDHDAELLHATKHSPAKWFPLVDKVYAVGAPFGFGATVAVVGGGPAFTDIIDPIECIPRLVR